MNKKERSEAEAFIVISLMWLKLLLKLRIISIQSEGGDKR